MRIKCGSGSWGPGATYIAEYFAKYFATQTLGMAKSSGLEIRKGCTLLGRDVVTSCDTCTGFPLVSLFQDVWDGWHNVLSGL